MSAPSLPNGQSKPVRLPPMHSRTRELPAGDEEARETLHLGEFATAPTLSLSEARILISHVLDSRAKNTAAAGYPMPTITPENALGKTQVYLDMFARLKDQASVMAVEGALHELAGNIQNFERAQLGNLMAQDADEAKSLIPSLKEKVGDEELEEVLDKILKARALA